MAIKELSEVKDTLETLKAAHRAAISFGESRRAFMLAEEIEKLEEAAKGKEKSVEKTTVPETPKAKAKAAPKKIQEDESAAMNQLTSLKDLLREALKASRAAGSMPELAPLADMLSAVTESLAEMADDIETALDMDGEFEFELDDDEFEDDDEDEAE